MSTAASETSANAASSVPVQDKVLTLSFNQDCTAVAMGTAQSYSLFTITQNNTTEDNYICGMKPVLSTGERQLQEVSILERVFSSPWIAIVSDRTPHNLNIFDINKGTETYVNRFSTKILAVKFSRSRVIVCLEESVSIFELRTLRVLHTIGNIPSNPTGLCAVSPNKHKPYLAYPKNSASGEIQIFHTIELKEGVSISAHNGPLAIMAFDMSGERIASASNKGTVIRVHSSVDGTRLFEFRRGVRRFATIYSLAFSPDSKFLAASSNTGTIHIFRMITPIADAPEEPGTWMGSVGRLIGGVAFFLPQQTSEVFTQDRSFAMAHLPSAELRTTIAMNVWNEKLILFVGTYDGVVSVYEVNTSDGGECKKLSQCDLFDMSVSSKNDQLRSSYLRRSTIDEPIGERPSNTIRNDDQSASTTKNAT